MSVEAFIQAFYVGLSVIVVVWQWGSISGDRAAIKRLKEKILALNEKSARDFWSESERDAWRAFPREVRVEALRSAEQLAAAAKVLPDAQKHMDLVRAIEAYRMNGYPE